MSFQLHAESFSPKNLIRLAIGQARRQDWAAVILLFAAWAAAVLLVNPSGDFPLNDDFSYGKSVRNLAVDGKFLLDSWLAQTLAAQVFWGAAFCEIFGFSFTVLRFSTLVLGFAGVAASYFLCRELGQGRRVALLFAATVAFNPLFFSLSFTFMTDVPFFAFSMLSSLFFIRALSTSAGLKTLPTLASTLGSPIFLGTFFALAATFVRQIGLMLPVAFAVAWLCRSGFRWKFFPVALLPAAVILAAFFGYNHWLEQSQGLPPGYGNFTRLTRTFDSPDILSRILPRTGILLAYLGAFFLPVSLVLVGNSFPKSWRFRKTCLPAAVLLVFSVAACIAAWERLPWANMIYNFGLGPKLLKDGQFFINVSPMLPENAVAILKVAAFASGILLAVLLLARFLFREPKSDPSRGTSNSLPMIFALSNLALYLGFLIIDKHFFDRYFLQLMPLLGMCLLSGRPVSTLSANRSFRQKPAIVVVLVCSILMATFSIAATHDYLAWNRARWQALYFLTDDLKIAPNRIDGGFEFNGWHKPGEREYGRQKSWWWVDKDDFVVAFGEMDGFAKMKGFAFQKWLPPGVDSVWVLTKK